MEKPIENETKLTTETNNFQNGQSFSEFEIPKAEQDRTMNLSIVEGSIANLSIVTADNYMIPFGLFLGIPGSGIGIITSFNGLLAPFGQIFGSKLMETQSRRKILPRWLNLQSMTWLLLIVLTILFSNSFLSTGSSIIFLAVYVSYIILGNVMGPAWFSLMADIVPNEKRGDYFGKRNFVTSIVGLAFIYLVSIILDNYKALDNLALGFIIVFAIAFLTRQVSVLLIKKHYYPHVVYERRDTVKLSTFLKNLSKTNFGIFCVFVALINMGQAISGPYFTVYMLNVLNFNYVTYSTVVLANSFTAILVFPIAGKLADKYGNITILKVGALIIPILPILWVFLTTPIALSLGPQFLSGIGWTLFNLSASNFIIEAIPAKQRGYYLAYYNLMIGIGIFFGSIIGAIIFQFAGAIEEVMGFKMVFLISGLFRGAVVLILISKIKEIREKLIEKKAPTEETKIPVTQFQPTSIHRGTFLNLGVGRIEIKRKISKLAKRRAEMKAKKMESQAEHHENFIH